MMPRILATHIRPLLERFGEVPELPLDELFWRIRFAFGAITQALCVARDWEITDSPLRDSSAELTIKSPHYFCERMIPRARRDVCY